MPPRPKPVPLEEFDVYELSICRKQADLFNHAQDMDLNDDENHRKNTAGKQQ